MNGTPSLHNARESSVMLSKGAFVHMLLSVVASYVLLIGLTWALHHFFPDVVTPFRATVATIVFLVLFFEAAIQDVFFEWRSWHYVLTETAVILRHGVVFRHEKAVAIAQVLSVRSSQGPILKMLKLHSVKLETTIGDIALHPLVITHAEAIRDWVLDHQRRVDGRE